MFDGTAESSKNNNPFAKYSGYMLLIIIICIPWIITLQSENSDLKDNLETANETIEGMTVENDHLYTLYFEQIDKVSELEEENKLLTSLSNNLRSVNSEYYSAITWFDTNVAICTPTGSKYHTYDCHYWKDSEYVYIYSVGDALSRGYEPCSYCQ